MKALIGVDIGTQGTKAALFTEHGECLAQAFCRSRLHQPAAGVVEEDPEEQFASVCRTIRQCVRKSAIAPADVVGIGIDGQMAGVIGVGTDGRHVTPYDSWLDTRCAPYITRMDRKAGREILEKTGCPPSINHGPKKLWWKHERKDAYRQIAAFVQPGGYVAMRLCGLSGAEAFIDTTYLHFSGFADNRKSQWDVGLCKTFGMDAAKLPRIVRPETVVGTLMPGATRACGLRASVPVVAGCGDTAAGFLACGATHEGISVDVAGTASVFASTMSSFRADHKHRMLGCGQSVVPGLWHPYAYINGGGMNLEWFLREIANRGEARKASGITFGQLDQLAENIIPDDTLPLFAPHLGGRVCPSQAHMRGAWVGLSWAHGIQHLYRAVLEGVALEYALYKQVLQSMYKKASFSELRITGGGERSALWNRIKADALQMPVRRIARSEGVPLGAALVAGYGVGLFNDLSAAANRWITVGEAVSPNKDLAAYYTKRRARYGKLLDTLAEM